VVVTACAAIWWKPRGNRDLIPGPEVLGATEDGKRTFYALVPLILGIHVGLPLIILGVKGALFSPQQCVVGRLALLDRSRRNRTRTQSYLWRTNANCRYRACIPMAHWHRGCWLEADAGELALPRIRRILLPRRTRTLFDGPAAISSVEVDRSESNLGNAMLTHRHGTRPPGGCLHREARQPAACLRVSRPIPTQLYKLDGHPHAQRTIRVLHPYLLAVRNELLSDPEFDPKLTPISKLPVITRYRESNINLRT
jgi:hypothetical protein